MTRRLSALALVLAALALTAAACASGSPSTEPSYPADAVIISADNMTFSTDQLIVPAGKPFTLVFKNKEAVPHNVAITTEADGKGTVLFRFDPITAKTGVYDVPAIAAGTYFFRCDVHPSMHGTVLAQ
jgi:plastocyanin